MTPERDPVGFLVGAVVIIALLLTCTIWGRIILRRIAIALLVLAAAAVVYFEGAGWQAPL